MTIINRIHKHRISRLGFTMIEALVSLSIIFVLINVFLANYRVGNQKGDIDMAAQKLASDINLVRSYALGLKEHNGSFPAGGWGISFHNNLNGYNIFADVDANNRYHGSNELYRTINLEQKFEISNVLLIDCQAGNQTRNHRHVVFTPPEPLIRINGGNAPNNFIPAGATNCGGIQITLRVRNTNFTRNVSINRYGLIEIN